MNSIEISTIVLSSILIIFFLVFPFYKSFVYYFERRKVSPVTKVTKKINKTLEIDEEIVTDPLPVEDTSPKNSPLKNSPLKNSPPKIRPKPRKRIRPKTS